MSEDFGLISSIVFIFIILSFIYYYIETNLENHIYKNNTKKRITTKIIETLSNPIDSFCEHYETNPNELRSHGSKLTQKNCSNSKCTIWLKEKEKGEGRCVVGNASGPTFKTDNGVKMDIDSYYYMNKCYGSCS
jgi:hypothetical protein